MTGGWFKWYSERAVKGGGFASYNGRFLCPCCFMPTLDERIAYEICPICFWEDDGQDTANADARGGVNHGYSLLEARSNFSRSHTMYLKKDDVLFEMEMARMPFKVRLYNAFEHAITSGDPADFENAIAIQESEEEDDNGESGRNGD